MAPIDIVQAQAEVASNEQNVIVAEAAITQAEDGLRALILDPATPGVLGRSRSIRPTRRRSRTQPIDMRRRRPERAREAVGSAAGAEQPRAERHQHPLLPQPDPARRQRAGELRHDRRRRRAAEPGQPVRRPARCPPARSSPSAATAPCWATCSRARIPSGRSACRSAIRSASNTAQANLGAREAAVRAGADAAQEPRAAGGDAGPRRRPPGADEPAARPVGARVARAAGEEARRRGEEVRGRHVDQLLRLPGAARPGAARARSRSRRSSTTTSRSSISKPSRKCHSPARRGTVTQRRGRRDTDREHGHRANGELRCRSCRSRSSPRTRRPTSPRPWRRCPGPTRSSSSTRTARTTPWRSPGRHTDRVIVRDWPGYVAQKNYAASTAAHDWILSLDADERVTPELASEIRDLMAGAPAHAGYRVPRVTWHLGRWIRTTDWYPDYQLRLYDRRAPSGPAATCTSRSRRAARSDDCAGELQHYAYRDIADHLETIDRYTTYAARQMFEDGQRAGVLQIAGPSAARLPAQLRLARRHPRRRGRASSSRR